MITRASGLPWGGESTMRRRVLRKYTIVSNKKDVFSNGSQCLAYVIEIPQNGGCIDTVTFKRMYCRNFTWKRLARCSLIQTTLSPPSPPLPGRRGRVDHHRDGHLQLLPDCSDVWRWTFRMRSRSAAAAAIYNVNNAIYMHGQLVFVTKASRSVIFLSSSSSSIWLNDF